MTSPVAPSVTEVIASRRMVTRPEPRAAQRMFVGPIESSKAFQRRRTRRRARHRKYGAPTVVSPQTTSPTSVPDPDPRSASVSTTTSAVTPASTSTSAILRARATARGSFSMLSR